MPRGNGTGPNGMGSMTGRGLGYCSGDKTPGFAKNFGGGMGRGRGFGRGFRMQNFNAPVNTQQDEKAFLEQNLELLKSRVDMIQSRINELEQE